MSASQLIAKSGLANLTEGRPLNIKTGRRIKMHFEPTALNGKYYKMGDGRKVQIFLIEKCCIWGRYKVAHNHWKSAMWLSSGAWTGSNTKKNITEIWTDPPQVPDDFWTRVISPWMNVAAMDGDKKWYQYSINPEHSTTAWQYNHIAGLCSRIPPEYAPKFSGDWKDSLIVRPGYEETK